MVCIKNNPGPTHPLEDLLSAGKVSGVQGEDLKDLYRKKIFRCEYSHILVDTFYQIGFIIANDRKRGKKENVKS